jgi:hypothetical protein
MSRILNFYMDDSGTRTPNRKPLPFNPRVRDFFALGGVLINEEDEAATRKAYDDFRERWQLDYPLHSVEIRHRSGRFSWLKRDTDEYERFMRDLARLLTSINVLGLACVIDRPGYDARYREKYGRRQWHLCQTAFCIAVERAAKFARRHGCKLRVMPERSCRVDDRRLANCYEALKMSGAPFEKHASSIYAPLNGAEFAETLHEIRFKSKSSPLGQIADVFLWPLVLSAYGKSNRACETLRDAGRFIESRLSAEEIEACGSKRSCFELVDSHQRIP